MRSSIASVPSFAGIVLKDIALCGVVLDADDRLTDKNFGDFKSETRKYSERELREYMRSPSQTRSDARDTKRDFTIAVTLAPPGTGKSRFLDDAMRMPLESPHFDHFLRVAISVNGESQGLYRLASCAISL